MMKRVLTIVVLTIVCCLPAMTQDSIAVSDVFQKSFDEAIELFESNQIEAVEKLQALKANSAIPEYIRLNCSIILADFALNEGNAELRDVSLREIESYLEQHPDDAEVRATLDDLKEQMQKNPTKETFRDRLCGMWVTAEATPDGYPWFIMSIGREPHFWARFHDKTSIAGLLDNDSLMTENIDIFGAHRGINLHFGAGRNKKASSFSVNFYKGMAMDMAKSAATYRKKTGRVSASGEFGSLLFMALAKGASVSKKHFRMVDMEMTEIAPDVLKGRIFYEHKVERSDGEEDVEELRRTRELYLYRVVPSDSIQFMKNKRTYNVMTRQDSVLQEICIPLEEQPKQWEYACKTPDKPKISTEKYNEYSYRLLQSKIQKRLPLLSTEDAMMVEGELEYGPQGWQMGDGHYLKFDVLPGDYSFDKMVYGYSEDYVGPYKIKYKGYFFPMSTFKDEYLDFKRTDKGFEWDYSKEMFRLRFKKYKEAAINNWYVFKRVIDAKNAAKEQKKLEKRAKKGGQE